MRWAGVIAAVVLTAFVAATARPAAGSRYLRVGIYDEAQTLYGPVDKTFALFKQLHVQEVRLNLYWGGKYGVATRRPASATNPADPAYDWSLYDRTVDYAAQAGVHVLFSVYGTPGWANGGKGMNVAPTRAVDLRNFALAAAKRYSGTYKGPDGTVLPAVKEWLAWNEPNNPIFLTPQYRKTARGWVIQSAAAYAKICNAIYNGVHATLFGERARRVRRHGAAGKQQPVELEAVRLAARVSPRGEAGGAEDVRRLGAPPVLRGPERHPDDQAGHRQGRTGDGDHARQSQRPDSRGDAPVRQQAHLDHRVRLPDQPARPDLRRLVEETGGLPHAGVRDRAQEPADRHDALVPAQGRAESRRLAVGPDHVQRREEAIVRRVRAPDPVADRLASPMADPLTTWPGAERRNPPRSSPTWVVRAALADWLRAQAADLESGGPVRVLDVGCGVKPYYPFFAGVASEYVGVDVVENPAAELLGPVEALPVDDASFDVVLCTQVLEHCDDPAAGRARAAPRDCARRPRPLLDARRAGLPPLARSTTGAGRTRACARLFEQNATWSALSVEPGAGTALRPRDAARHVRGDRAAAHAARPTAGLAAEPAGAALDARSATLRDRSRDR